MDKVQLIESLDKTTADLLGTLYCFSNEQFNQVPFEGSWTAGQVAEHLFKAEGSSPDLLTGHTVKTTRNPEQFVKPLDDIFLDFSTKLKSPEFILPGDGPHDQATYFNYFRNTRKATTEIAREKDLTETCTDFEFPGIGALTRYELLRFVVSHSTRHIRQLNNILKHVSS